jgi:hypothetical protein
LRDKKTAKPIKFTELWKFKDDKFKAQIRGIRFRTYGSEYMAGLDDNAGEMLEHKKNRTSRKKSWLYK